MSAVYDSMGHSFLRQIDAIVDPLFLADADLKSIRTASAEQRRELENTKFAVLCCLKPGDEVTVAKVREARAAARERARATLHLQRVG